MQCPACGKDVKEEAVFCDQCGHRLSGEGGSESAPPRKIESSKPRDVADRSREAFASRDTDDDPDAVLWEGTFSAKGLVGSWLLAVIATVVAIVLAVVLAPSGIFWVIPLAVALILWIVLAVVVAYEKFSISYKLTNQRFLHRTGLLSQTTDRIETIDMDDVRYKQSLLQRLVGVGTIQITSSDRSHPELTLYGIDNVHEVADLIDNVRRAERRRRGLHIESI